MLLRDKDYMAEWEVSLSLLVEKKDSEYWSFPKTQGMLIADLDKNGAKSLVFYGTEISTIYGPVDF